jgi:ABC-type multidrug transport system fused ATPase/permease subunit
MASSGKNPAPGKGMKNVNTKPALPLLKRVPVKQLFRFADRLDLFMFWMSIFLNAAQGAALPSFAFIIGNVLTTVAVSGADFVKQTETFCVYFLIIGSGLLVCAFTSSVFGMVSSERQANRIRVAYFASMLRQDQGWFDLNTPGEVASRMQEDTNSVQGGINESIGQAVQYIMTFVIGLIIGFVR